MFPITITTVLIKVPMVGNCVIIDSKNSQSYNMYFPLVYTEVMPKLKCTSLII
jgi:hypothetical protein